MESQLLAVLGAVFCTVSISWNRMGPAYQRHRMAWPLFLAGSGAILSWDLNYNLSNDLLCGLYDSCEQANLPANIRHLALWSVIFYFGSVISITNSGAYGKSKTVYQILGWSLIISSLLLAVYYRPNPEISYDLFGDLLSVVAGMFVGMLFVAMIVTVSEIFDRDAPPSRALSGQEKDRIIAIITDNLGRGEK